MIKFPKVHIAESVVNRIMDTYEELDRRGSSSSAPPLPVPPPSVPDGAAAGAELDAKLMTPPGNVPPLEPPEPTADELAGVVARGDDLITA